MAKARKRLVFGASETVKFLELGKLKGIIIARNLTPDSLLAEDFKFCINAKSVPVIYCGSRKKLGLALLSPRALIGMIGVLKIDGVEQAWSNVVLHWSKLSKSWLEERSANFHNLWSCAYFNHVELLKAIYAKHPIEILMQYVNEGSPEFMGKTMILIAAERDNFEIMEILLHSLGADEDIPDFTLNLPIHLVQSAKAAALLKYNHKRNAAGKSPIEVAAENGRLEVLDHFIKSGPDTIDIGKLLFASVKCKKSTSIALLLKKLKIGNLETFTNDEGHDLIMAAVDSGSYETFKYLIKLNYRVNYQLKSNSREGIIEIATRTGNQGISRYLVKHESK